MSEQVKEPKKIAPIKIKPPEMPDNGNVAKRLINWIIGFKPLEQWEKERPKSKPFWL